MAEASLAKGYLLHEGLFWRFPQAFLNSLPPVSPDDQALRWSIASDV
jgi:hypothetical protein